MSDFSIDLMADRIRDTRTRNYFREVFASYANGSYRSATVMLWSVVVCDLLFKLEELRATYGDATASGLLQEVEQQRASNPRSPEWELWLVDEIRKRTKLLEEHEYQAVSAIQKHRHLAAHPTLTSGYELHSPTPEAVRADIRAALEGVLTKPALMTKKVFDALVEDLEAKQNHFVDDDSLRRYLEAKFFSHLLPAVGREVFKSLWHVVFAGTDERCTANRKINYRALSFLYDRSPEEFLKLIESDRKRFSKIAVERTILKLALDFIAVRPRIYDHLTDEAKSPIQDFVTKGSAGLLGWFALPGGAQLQIERLKADKDFVWASCGLDDFQKWVDVLGEFGLADEAAALAVRAYVQSDLYDTADHRFRLLLAVSERLTPALLVECLNGIEHNNQTYGRGRARVDHKELMAVADRVLGQAFDYSKFPRFVSSIG